MHSSLNIKWDTLDYIDKLYSDCNNNVNRMLNLFALLYAWSLHDIILDNTER